MLAIIVVVHSNDGVVGVVDVVGVVCVVHVVGVSGCCCVGDGGSCDCGVGGCCGHDCCCDGACCCDADGGYCDHCDCDGRRYGDRGGADCDCCGGEELWWCITWARKDWVPEASLSGRLSYRKVSETKNASDILTKHIQNTLLDRHFAMLKAELRDGSPK